MYIVFGRSVRYNWIKALLEDEADISYAEKGEKICRRYCTKQWAYTRDPMTRKKIFYKDALGHKMLARWPNLEDIPDIETMQPNGGYLDAFLNDFVLTAGPWEWGDMRRGGQGQQTQILDIIDATVCGATRGELLDMHPTWVINHTRAVEWLRDVKLPGRDMFNPDDKPKVFLLLGPSGGL